jgi:hypothetical protein
MGLITSFAVVAAVSGAAPGRSATAEEKPARGAKNSPRSAGDEALERPFSGHRCADRAAHRLQP